MPWNTRDAMSLKAEFIALALLPDSNRRELCRRFNISPQTAYKWLKRYVAEGAAGLQEQSRRPRSSPRQASAEIEAQVVALRRAHPAWGGRKISHALGCYVAPSTVTNILHRNNLVESPASEAKKPWQRFEHEAPNDLWQMDFKGHFQTHQGQCHPLTLIDDHSRFSLAIQACANERRQTVQERLIEVFRRYGLPERINTDNGAPWGSPRNPGELSELGVWLVSLGIRLSFSRPYHPQTNGKDERFHRSLKLEVLKGRHFHDLAEAQSAFDRWREIYNQQRPHEALSYQVPINRYRTSPWKYPEQPTEFEYGLDDVLAKVYHSRFRFRKRYFRIAKGLAGKVIAIRPHSDAEHLFDVYFCHQLLRTIDLNDPECSP